MRVWPAKEDAGIVPIASVSSLGLEIGFLTCHSARVMCYEYHVVVLFLVQYIEHALDT